MVDKGLTKKLSTIKFHLLENISTSLQRIVNLLDVHERVNWWPLTRDVLTDGLHLLQAIIYANSNGTMQQLSPSTSRLLLNQQRPSEVVCAFIFGGSSGIPSLRQQWQCPPKNGWEWEGWNDYATHPTRMIFLVRSDPPRMSILEKWNIRCVEYLLKNKMHLYNSLSLPT